MFRINSIIIVIVILLCSCSQVGKYYTIDKDGEIEDFQFVVKNTQFNFAATIIDQNFNAILYTKLLDTFAKNSELYNLSLNINNETDESSKKILNCIDSPGKIIFESLDEIPDFSRKMHTGLPLQFVYQFNEASIKDQKVIKVIIKLIFKDTTENNAFTKSFRMYEQKRYRSWFVTK